MIAALLPTLLLAGADPAAMIAHAAALTAPVTAAPAAPRTARWRVSSDGDTGPDGKARAAATTGTPCGVVGTRLCTRAPHTWLTAPLGR